MIPGPKDGEGRLFTEASAPSQFSIGGVGHTASGAVAIVTVAPTKFVNGLPFNNIGRLCTANNDVIHHFLNGLPRSNTGRLVVVPDGTPGPNDPYVGELRVGPAGIYTSTSTPPVDVVIPATPPIWDTIGDMVDPAWFGPECIPRASATDSQDVSIFTFNNPLILPKGELFGVRIYRQTTAVAHPNGNIYVMILRPTGSLNEFECVYKSEQIDLNESITGEINEYAIGPFAVHAGDQCMYVGKGWAWGNDNLFQDLSLTASPPTVGQIITLGSDAYTDLYHRIYSIQLGVNVPVVVLLPA